jgi:ribosomal protein S18 acetylase RimI-like enzyme
LNFLFASAWIDYQTRNFEPILARSLGYICAYSEDELVGFVNLAWDGGVHAFLLDTTVSPAWRKQGIGCELVKHATALAQVRGIEWLHVDYEAHLDGFYRSCGFTPTLAGLIHLSTGGEDHHP